MTTQRKTAVLLILTLVLAGIGGYEAGQLSKKGLETQVQRIQEQLKNADKEIETLRKQIGQGAPEGSAGEELTAELKNNGFEGPEQVARDLQAHPEQIPLKAVLGGTMSYSRIVVINGHWAFASYEDGHVAGSALYSFEKGGDGGIRWTVLVSEQE